MASAPGNPFRPGTWRYKNYNKIVGGEATYLASQHVTGTPTNPVTSQNQNTLAELWIQAGGSPKLANIMAAIAMAESSGNPQAVDHDSNGSTDYGLWQINSVHDYDPNKLLNSPLYNAQAAVAVYNSQGLGAWTTYTNGAYKQFLPVSSKATVQNPITRPGGDPVNPDGSQQDTGTGVQQIFADYETELTLPRMAPSDAGISGPTGPFKWWLSSFTNQWDEETGG